MTAVLFDVDGVLVHGYHAKPEFRKCWDENLERDFGILRKDFFEQFISGVFIKEVLIGKKDLHEALSEVLPTIGYTDDAQNIIDYWMVNDANLNPDLMAQIEKLSKLPDVDLYIATNQDHNRARYLMQNMGLSEHFNDIFHSGRVGHLKPKPEYFDYINDNINAEEGRDIIFFDDTQAVVDGANAAGWQAHQFDTVDDLRKSPQIVQLLNL